MAKVQNVQGLRAIAAVLVVFVHISGTGGFTSENFDADPFAVLYGIGNVGVDLFFAISGFIMIVTTSRVEHSLGNAGLFLLRRAVRIYPTYILVTMCILAARMFFAGFGPPGESTDVAASLLLLPQTSIPVLFVGWTLVYEMYFYLWFALSLSVSKQWQIPILSIWGLFTILLAILVDSDSPFLALMAGPLNMEFLFGIAVGTIVLRGHMHLPLLSLALGISALLVAYFVILPPGANLPSTWARVLLAGIPSAIILYGFIGLENRGWLLPQGLNAFGDSSYALYLIHVPLLKILGVVAGMFLPPTNFGAFAGATLALAGCCAGAHIFRKLVEDPLRHLLEKPLPRLVKASAVRW